MKKITKIMTAIGVLGVCAGAGTMMYMKNMQKNKTNYYKIKSIMEQK